MKYMNELKTKLNQLNSVKLNKLNLLKHIVIMNKF